MARPKKNGLDYFPLDADFFSDKKIKTLKARYGADGITIYLYLLCEIYKSGYYIKVDDDFQYIMSDDLGMSINKVKQVLKFLLERSLFDHKLFQSDTILTSAGIQKRYQIAVKERAKKTPIKIDGFWVLKEEETEPFIKVTHFVDNSQKNEGFSQKNQGNSREQSLKESKVNNIEMDSTKETKFENPELEKAFQLFVQMRNSNNAVLLTKEQIQVLREELLSLSQEDSERMAIVKKAFASGWKSFYPLKREKKEKTQTEFKKTVAPNRFHNFEQRTYDYADLEQRFIKKANSVNVEDLPLPKQG